MIEADKLDRSLTWDDVRQQLGFLKFEAKNAVKEAEPWWFGVREISRRCEKGIWNSQDSTICRESIKFTHNAEIHLLKLAGYLEAWTPTRWLKEKHPTIGPE
jgi:hypothetical protein